MRLSEDDAAAYEAEYEVLAILFQEAKEVGDPKRIKNLRQQLSALGAKYKRRELSEPRHELSDQERDAAGLAWLREFAVMLVENGQVVLTFDCPTGATQDSMLDDILALVLE